MIFKNSAHRIVYYLLGIIGLNKSDVLLSSFPRSGNTWIRFMLCNLISFLEWDGRQVDFDMLNKTMVELGVSNLIKPWPYQTVPRVVKTHIKHVPFFRKNPSIGIIRDPRDVMVSYYHYETDRKGVDHGSFSDFIRNSDFGLESWFNHYVSWRDRWDLIIQYEHLRINDFHEFERILNFLNVNCTSSIAERAVIRSRLERTKDVDDMHDEGIDEDAYIARNGRCEQWKNYFSDSDLDLYSNLSEIYNVKIYPLESI